MIFESHYRAVFELATFAERRRQFWLWATLAYLVLLTGCATLHGRAQHDFELLPPDSLIPVTLLLEIDSFDTGINRHWEAVLNVDNEYIYLAILGPLGQRLATLRTNSHGVTVETGGDLIPIDVPSEELLVELQMIFWPLSALNVSEGNRNWHFEEQQQIRHVYFEQQLVGDIHQNTQSPMNGAFIYVSKIFDHSLHVRSIVLTQ